MRCFLRSLLVLASFLFLSAGAQAVVLHDESIHGDLSGVATPFGTLGVGSYTIIGSALPQDIDVFTFDLAPGTELTGFMNSYWSVRNAPAYIRMNDDPFYFAHHTNIGQNFLTMSGIGPLGPGTHILGTGTGADPFDYQMELIVERISAVPLPAALPLYGIGLFVLGWIGVKRKSKV